MALVSITDAVIDLSSLQLGEVPAKVEVRLVDHPTCFWNDLDQIGMLPSIKVDAHCFTTLENLVMRFQTGTGEHGMKFNRVRVRRLLLECDLLPDIGSNPGRSLVCEQPDDVVDGETDTPLIVDSF